MAGEWPTATIKELAEKVAMGPFGSSIKVSTFVPDGIPVISGQHLHGVRLEDSDYNFITEDHAERLRNANVQRGDVVFTHAGNIGQVAFIPETSRYDRYVLSQRQFYLRCDRTKILSEFVAYYFHSPAGQHKLMANASQTGVPSLAQPVSYLRTIDIPVPPLPEQRAIAHVLGTLDDKIELNRKMNETLEEMARAIFDHFFPYSPEDNLPKGWRIGMIGDVADIGSGKRPICRSDHMTSEMKVPLYGGGGIMAYTANAHTKRPILLTGRVGTLGMVFRISGPCWPSDNTLVITPRNESFYDFLYFTLRQVEFEALNRGSTQPLVTQGDILRQRIVIPPKKVVEEFQSQTSLLFAMIQSTEYQSRTLATLRDALLPKLLSGEIGVDKMDQVDMEARQ